MTSRISVAVAALALVLASGAAVSVKATDSAAGGSSYSTGSQGMTQPTMSTTASQGGSTYGTTTTSVGRSTPATGMEPGTLSSMGQGVPAKTPVMGTWQGIDITPQMVWKAMEQQGLKPLNGFLVRYGDVIVADAARGDQFVKVAFDPRTGMIRDVH
jgi:hypothetical protein